MATLLDVSHSVAFFLMGLLAGYILTVVLPNSHLGLSWTLFTWNDLDKFGRHIRRFFRRSIRYGWGTIRHILRSPRSFQNIAMLIFRLSLAVIYAVGIAAALNWIIDWIITGSIFD